MAWYYWLCLYSFLIGLSFQKMIKTKIPTKVSIKKYREILGDYLSSDEKILERLEYLEAFCGNIIRLELEKTIKI